MIIFITYIMLLKVLSKDSSQIEDAADVRENVRNCLRKAALVNYTMLSEYAKIEGMLNVQENQLNNYCKYNGACKCIF